MSDAPGCLCFSWCPPVYLLNSRPAHSDCDFSLLVVITGTVFDMKGFSLGRAGYTGEKAHLSFNWRTKLSLLSSLTFPCFLQILL